MQRRLDAAAPKPARAIHTSKYICVYAIEQLPAFLNARSL